MACWARMLLAVHKHLWSNCNVDMKRPMPVLESLNAPNLYILVEAPSYSTDSECPATSSPADSAWQSDSEAPNGASRKYTSLLVLVTPLPHRTLVPSAQPDFAPPQRDCHCQTSKTSGCISGIWELVSLADLKSIGRKSQGREHQSWRSSQLLNCASSQPTQPDKS
jgi:hypothetical protein